MMFKSDKQRKKVMGDFRGRDYVPVGRDRSLPISDGGDSQLLNQIRGMKQTQKNKDDYIREQKKELTEKQLNFLRNQRMFGKGRVYKCRKCGREIVKGTSRCPKCGVV